MGVLALIPLTGVPLPFLSYGGSFNINVVIMIFMVLRVSIETSINDERRAIRNIR
jgi:cell division protein FtsW